MHSRIIFPNGNSYAIERSKNRLLFQAKFARRKQREEVAMQRNELG